MKTKEFIQNGNRLINNNSLYLGIIQLHRTGYSVTLVDGSEVHILVTKVDINLAIYKNNKKITAYARNKRVMKMQIKW